MLKRFYIVRTTKTVLKEWRKRRLYVPELGERHTLCNWIREEDNPQMVDMHRYSELLSLLPDKIVTSLEHARLERAGKVQILKAGLGYEEVLASAIVDGSAIASSSTEANLFPNLLLPPNYLQPGGLPGRTLHSKARGRVTTLTTSGTMTFSLGAATTNATIPTTRWASSGALIADATAVTNGMWEVECSTVVRSVGAAGTVFSMGDVDWAAQRFAGIAAGDHALNFMGSAGSTAPATAAVDMTVAEYKILTAKWSLATAYSIQGHQYIVEAMN